MAALYPPWSNLVFRTILAALALALAAVVVVPMIYVRTPWNTAQFVPADQPVEFDHRHHVIDDEIDCLYCHRDAEKSPHAGVPATEVCMGCHAQVWNQSPLLEPVRRSYFSGKPLTWNRVHDLGDFAYFNHAVHVRRGIGCVHCHGRVDRMARVYKVMPLTMKFCLDCHRNPRATLRQQQSETTAAFASSSLWGASLQSMEPELPDGTREITRLTTCTACHR